MNIEQIINQLIEARIEKLKQDSLNLSFLRINQKIDKIDNIIHLKDVDSFKTSKEELKEEFQGNFDNIEKYNNKIRSMLLDCETKGQDNHALIELLDSRVEELESNSYEFDERISDNTSSNNILEIRVDDLENTLEELNLIDVKCLNDRLDYKCDHYDQTIDALEKNFYKFWDHLTQSQSNVSYLLTRDESFIKLLEDTAKETHQRNEFLNARLEELSNENSSLKRRIVEMDMEYQKRLLRIESFFHQIGNYFDLYNDVQNDIQEDEVTKINKWTKAYKKFK